MSTPPPAKPAPPPTDWGRMGNALVRLVRADPRLAGMETPVRVELHEKGVGYAVGSGFTPTSIWLHRPRWWEPLTQGRARELHGILAAALLAVVGKAGG